MVNFNEIKTAAQYAAHQLRNRPITGPSKIINHIADGTVGEYVGGAGRLAAKAGKGLGGLAFKQEEKTFWNGYTGLKETKPLAVAAWAGAGAWGVGSVGYKYNTIDKSQENVTYANEPNETTYDYVSSAPTLGASGSMVFGLHNGRRG